MPQYTRMAISLQRLIRSTSCLVLGWGFRGRRIKRRYLRFEQIQDGGRRHVGKISNVGHKHVGKISNNHISATGRPIHFMFGYRVEFSGTADLMALFSIRTNSRWRPLLSWITSNGHIAATAHDLLIQRASRGYLCDSTAFLSSMLFTSLIRHPRVSPSPSDGLTNDLCKLHPISRHSRLIVSVYVEALSGGRVQIGMSTNVVPLTLQ